MRNKLFDSATNKDMMMLIFVELVNQLAGTRFNWNTMNKKEKATFCKLQKDWDYGDEDPDWMEQVE